MLKRLFYSCTAFGAALLLLVSCGSKVVTPAKETISGPLGEYFKVVERNYKVNEGKISVEIERTSEGLPSPWKEGVEVGYLDGKIEPGFNVEFLDSDGDVLCSDKSNIVYDIDELKAIVALAVGESTSISFEVNEKKVSSFRVSSTFEYHKPESTSVISSARSIYDEAADEYSKIMKEAQDEYAKMYQEAADEMKDAIDDALDDL